MKPMKTQLSITLDWPIVEQIKIRAEADDRSVSQYINLVLKEHLEKLKSSEK
ncbi:MAG: toxin-antitoxin system protein [Ruthenibacterium sp.]